MTHSPGEHHMSPAYVLGGGVVVVSNVVAYLHDLTLGTVITAGATLGMAALGGGAIAVKRLSEIRGQWLRDNAAVEAELAMGRAKLALDLEELRKGHIGDELEKIKADALAEKARAAAEIDKIRREAAMAVEEAHRKADAAEAVAFSARQRIKNLEDAGFDTLVAVKANRAAAAAAQGMASAGLDAIRKGHILPDTPNLPPVPGTNWPLVLVVEDEPRAAKALPRMLMGLSFRVHAAGTVAEALEALQDNPSIAWIDYKLPDGTGDEVIREIRGRALNTRAFIFTGEVLDDATRDGLIALGAEAVITKGTEGSAELMRRIQAPPPA